MPGLRLLAATVDPATQMIELDIEGPGIPHAERIAAVFTKERLTVRFEPKA